MSGKYDFEVTSESIEMMEDESKVIEIGHTMLKHVKEAVTSTIKTRIW
jgi:hypothetical protein